MFLVVTGVASLIPLSGVSNRFFPEGVQISKERQVLRQSTTGRENHQKTLMPPNWQSRDCASIQGLNARRGVQVS